MAVVGVNAEVANAATSIMPSSKLLGFTVNKTIHHKENIISTGPFVQYAGEGLLRFILFLLDDSNFDASV